MTVVTLAMMLKDEQGNKMIPVENLEHAANWTRGTKVLSQYMNENVTFCRGSFMQKMAQIRDEEMEKDLHPEDITRLASKKVVDTPEFFGRLMEFDLC